MLLHTVRPRITRLQIARRIHDKNRRLQRISTNLERRGIVQRTTVVRDVAHGTSELSYATTMDVVSKEFRARGSELCAVRLSDEFMSSLPRTTRTAS